MQQYKIVDLSEHPNPGEYKEGDLVQLVDGTEFQAGNYATEYTSLVKGKITLKGKRLQLVSSSPETVEPTIQLYPLN